MKNKKLKSKKNNEEKIREKENKVFIPLLNISRIYLILMIVLFVTAIIVWIDISDNMVFSMIFLGLWISIVTDALWFYHIYKKNEYYIKTLFSLFISLIFFLMYLFFNSLSNFSLF